jgi:hypothetical protein
MFLTGLLLCLSLVIQASEKSKQSMNNQRLAELIQRVDKSAQDKPGYWVFVVEGRKVSVISDEAADRMRIIVPVAPTKDINKDLLYRLMQANFDSAPDARYSIANDILWTAFIHPLSDLGDKEFLSGLGQTVNLALTYGDSYSSGALVFGGGDSQALRRRELIDKLLRDGLAI